MIEQRERKRKIAATERITMLETPVSPFLATGATSAGAATFFLEPFEGIYCNLSLYHEQRIYN
jgi:hypothetical protein